MTAFLVLISFLSDCSTRSSQFTMEPAVGFEPTTCRLRIVWLGCLDVFVSGSHCWQGFANAPGEIWSVIGSQCGVVDPGTQAQFCERQCPVHKVHAVKIAIDETVREMFDVKLGRSARVC